MTRNRRLLMAAVLLLEVAAFAYFVWPTPWEPEVMVPVGLKDPEMRGMVESVIGPLQETWRLRKHRLTGTVQVWTNAGWEDFGLPSKPNR